MQGEGKCSGSCGAVGEGARVSWGLSEVHFVKGVICRSVDFL